MLLFTLCEHCRNFSFQSQPTAAVITVSFPVSCRTSVHIRSFLLNTLTHCATCFSVYTNIAVLKCVLLTRLALLHYNTLVSLVIQVGSKVRWGLIRFPFFAMLLVSVNTSHLINTPHTLKHEYTVLESCVEYHVFPCALITPQKNQLFSMNAWYPGDQA